MKKNSTHIPLFVCFLLFLCFTDATAREVKIAIFEFAVHAQEDLSHLQSGIPALLPSRITVPGKISIIDLYRVKQAVQKQPEQYSLSGQTAVAKQLGADFFLSGSITKIGNNLSVDTLLVDVLDTENPSSHVIQSIGFDNMIPEINNFAVTIKNKIIGGPALPDHVPPAAAGGPGQPASRDTGTPVYEPRSRVEEKPLETTARFKPEPREAPSFTTPSPLFESSPSTARVVKHEPLHCLAAGDVNADGKKELLVAGNDTILIFRSSGSDLEQIDRIETELDENIVHIAVADMNGNGTDEIYISSYEGTYPNSFVLELRQKEYKKIFSTKKWFFRPYKQINGDVILLGQNAEGTNPFNGEILRLVWKKGELFAREEFIVPGILGIYGLAERDVDGDGSKDFIGFDKGLVSSRYTLKLLSYTGRVKWQDIEKMGGSPNSFPKLVLGEDLEKTETVPLRVLCADYNGDSRNDVIVAKNSKKTKGFLEHLVNYSQGKVLCLNWDGTDLTATWSSDMVGGYVTDYLVADCDNDDTKELYIVSVADIGFLGKAKNRITVFKQAVQ